MACCVSTLRRGWSWGCGWGWRLPSPRCRGSPWPGREHFPHCVPSFPSGTICCLSSTPVPISQQRLPSDPPPGEEGVRTNTQGLADECRDILYFFFFSFNLLKRVWFYRQINSRIKFSLAKKKKMNRNLLMFFFSMTDEQHVLFVKLWRDPWKSQFAAMEF